MTRAPCLRLVLVLMLAWAGGATIAVTAADAAPAFDFKKEVQALRKDVDAVRAVLDQAVSSAALAEKKQAVERYSALKDEIQAFTTKAVAAGKSEDDVGELLERFQLAALTKMDRDLRAAINEAGADAKPKE